MPGRGIEVRLGSGRSLVVEPGFEAAHLNVALSWIEAAIALRPIHFRRRLEEGPAVPPLCGDRPAEGCGRGLFHEGEHTQAARALGRLSPFASPSFFVGVSVSLWVVLPSAYTSRSS
jgi:hypothetical protein